MAGFMSDLVPGSSIAAVSFRDVSKRFKGSRGAVQALDGVTFDISPGEFFGLLGPNGAGKTTLINILAGLAQASAGRVLVHGHDVVADYAAARRAIEGLEAARTANGPWPAQHQLAHLQLMDRADYARLQGLATANIQPLWARLEPPYSDPSLSMIGKDRWPDVYAFRNMLNAGADYCLSSDWPVSTLNPFEIIETAITRQKQLDDDPLEPLGPDQALTIEECVQGYTVNAARACWRDHDTGMLRAGYSADIIILDRDIFAIPANEISQTRVLLTLFKGVEVWRTNKW